MIRLSLKYPVTFQADIRKNSQLLFFIRKSSQMKKSTLFFLTIFLLASCGSVNKRFQRGDYDGIVDKMVKKLVKKPSNTEYAQNLDKAYKLANERDLERVKYLKIENNPNNFDEIFLRYESLKSRQSKVRTVLPLNLNGTFVNYSYIDYDAEIVAAKRRAAEYYYNNAQKLLKNKDRMSYRDAYYQLIRAQDYSGDAFPGLNEMITQAQYNGTSRVIVEVQSGNRIMIAPEFRDELLTFNAQGLNTEWIQYNFRHVNDDIDYDYAVVINLLDILVSPEEIKTNDLVVKKEVPNGFDYALDPRGNVRKDTAGNDIKIPRFKTLQATLIESYQRKAVTLRGQLEIQELIPTKRLLIKEPLGAENVFQHSSARAIGDLEALSPEQKQQIQREFIPFPPDGVMIMNTAETLKLAIRNALYNNRRYIK